MTGGDGEETGSLIAPGESSDSSGSVDSFLRAVAEAPRAGASSLTPQGTAPELTLRAGALLAERYLLERRLGEGGMGVVWAATHTITERRVALKFLKSAGGPDSELRRRFLREARAAAAVDHPNVVKIIDVFELGDRSPVIVMDLLTGETLGQRLEREGPQSLSTTASIAIQIVSALGAAHRIGIVHRDLKPDNVFLVSALTSEMVKVLDFGVAKLRQSLSNTKVSETSTGSGAILGTVGYMSPEQALGQQDVDQRADVWALGIILYECLAGLRPVAGRNAAQLVHQLMAEGIEPLDRRRPDLPRDVLDLVGRMLSFSREHRPADIGEVGTVLARHAMDTHAASLEAPTPARRRTSRSVRVTVVAISAAIAAFVVRSRLHFDHAPALVAPSVTPSAEARVLVVPAPPNETRPPAPASSVSALPRSSSTPFTANRVPLRGPRPRPEGAGSAPAPAPTREPFRGGLAETAPF